MSHQSITHAYSRAYLQGPFILELVPSLEVDEFLRAFRRFCARRGLPSRLFSINATMFKSATKEITNIVRSPRLQES